MDWFEVKSERPWVDKDTQLSKPVLLFSEEGILIGRRLVEANGDRWESLPLRGEAEEVFGVTHWMPLPEPPKDGPELLVGPDHPAWAALGDDDWGAGTFAQWIHFVDGKDVVLTPPDNYCPAKLGEFLRIVLARGATSVRLGEP